MVQITINHCHCQLNSNYLWKLLACLQLLSARSHRLILWLLLYWWKMIGLIDYFVMVVARQRGVTTVSVLSVEYRPPPPRPHVIALLYFIKSIIHSAVLLLFLELTWAALTAGCSVILNENIEESGLPVCDEKKKRKSICFLKKM